MCVTVDMTVEVHIHSVLLSQEFVCPKLSFSAFPPSSRVNFRYCSSDLSRKRGELKCNRYHVTAQTTLINFMPASNLPPWCCNLESNSLCCVSQQILE